MSKRYALMNYTIQCKDTDSGRTGCFLFDEEHYRTTGKFRAISEVFPNLVALFSWDRDNGRSCRGAYIEVESNGGAS